MKISLRIKNQLVLLILSFLPDIFDRRHVALHNREYVQKTEYYTSLETPGLRRGLRGGGESFVSLAYLQSVDCRIISNRCA